MRKQVQPKWHRTLHNCISPIAACLRREGRLWLWFGAALAGVLAKGFFEAIRAGQSCRLTSVRVAMALVATLVTFRATYEQYRGVRASIPLLVQVCIAFQCGFFWQTVFNDLTAAQ